MISLNAYETFDEFLNNNILNLNNTNSKSDNASSFYETGEDTAPSAVPAKETHKPKEAMKPLIAKIVNNEAMEELDIEREFEDDEEEDDDEEEEEEEEEEEDDEEEDEEDEEDDDDDEEGTDTDEHELSPPNDSNNNNSIVNFNSKAAIFVLNENENLVVTQNQNYSSALWTKIKPKQTK